MSLSEPIETVYGHIHMVKSDFGDDYAITVSKMFGSDDVVYEARTRPSNMVIATGYKSAQSLYKKVESDRAKQIMKEL